MTMINDKCLMVNDGGRRLEAESGKQKVQNLCVLCGRLCVLCGKNRCRVNGKLDKL